VLNVKYGSVGIQPLRIGRPHDESRTSPRIDSSKPPGASSCPTATGFFPTPPTQRVGGRGIWRRNLDSLSGGRGKKSVTGTVTTGEEQRGGKGKKVL
jgi:hypothetical protein